MMEFVGLLAAVLTTSSFLPQAIKVIKEKNTSGISLGMYSMFTAGVFLWLIYGIGRSDFPVIIANAVTFVFAGTILAMKIKYK